MHSTGFVFGQPGGGDATGTGPAQPAAQRALDCDKGYPDVEVSTAHDVVQRSSEETADSWVCAAEEGVRVCIAVPRKLMPVDMARQLRTLAGRAVCAVWGAGADVLLQGDDEMVRGGRTAARVSVQATGWHYIATVELEAAAVAAGVCGDVKCLAQEMRRRLDPRHLHLGLDGQQAARLKDEDLVPPDELALFEVLRDNNLLPHIFARTQHTRHAYLSSSETCPVYESADSHRTGKYTLRSMSFEVVGEEENHRLPVIPRADYLGLWRTMLWIDARNVTVIDAPRLCPTALKEAVASAKKCNVELRRNAIHACFNAKANKEGKEYDYIVRCASQICGDGKDGHRRSCFPNRCDKVAGVLQEVLFNQNGTRVSDLTTNATGKHYSLPLPALWEAVPDEVGVEMSVLGSHGRVIFAGNAHTATRIGHIKPNSTYRVFGPAVYGDSHKELPWGRVRVSGWQDIDGHTHDTPVEAFTLLSSMCPEQFGLLTAGGVLPNPDPSVAQPASVLPGGGDATGTGPAQPAAQRALDCDKGYPDVEVSTAHDVVQRSSEETADSWVRAAEEGVRVCIAVPRKLMPVDMARQLRTLAGRAVCAVWGVGADVLLQGDDELVRGGRTAARVSVQATGWHYIATVELEAAAVAAGVCGDVKCLAQEMRRRLDPRHLHLGLDGQQAARLKDEDLVPPDELALFEVLRDNNLLPHIFARTQHTRHAYLSSSEPCHMYFAADSDTTVANHPRRSMSFEVVGVEENGRLPVVPRADYLGLWRTMLWIDARNVTVIDAPRLCLTALKESLASAKKCNVELRRNAIHACFNAKANKEGKEYDYIVRCASQICGDGKDGRRRSCFPNRCGKVAGVLEERLFNQNGTRVSDLTTNATGKHYSLPLPALWEAVPDEVGVEMSVLGDVGRIIFAGNAHTATRIGHINGNSTYRVFGPAVYGDCRNELPWGRVRVSGWQDIYGHTHDRPIEAFTLLCSLCPEQVETLAAGGVLPQMQAVLADAAEPPSVSPGFGFVNALTGVFHGLSSSLGLTGAQS